MACRKTLLFCPFRERIAALQARHGHEHDELCLLLVSYLIRAAGGEGDGRGSFDGGSVGFCHMWAYEWLHIYGISVTGVFSEGSMTAGCRERGRGYLK